MGSIVKSIGKAIGKIAKGIGKLVKKALPIILMAGVAYMGIAAYGAMGSGLTGAAAASGATNFTAGMGKITSGQIVTDIAGGVSNWFGGGQAMASTTGGLSSAGTMAGANMSTIGGQHAFYNNAPSTFGASSPTAGIQMMSGPNSAANLMGSGMSANSAIADAMKHQSDMMWKGNLLKAGGAFVSSMFDDSSELKKEDQRITEEEFKRRHTYGGFAMDSGKPSDYAKPGQPGHDPTGFWGQMGGPPQFGYPSSNKGGPRQFQQTALRTPSVNTPGIINSRQGQRQTAGLLGQRPKSVA